MDKGFTPGYIMPKDFPCSFPVSRLSVIRNYKFDLQFLLLTRVKPSHWGDYQQSFALLQALDYLIYWWFSQSLKVKNGRNKVRPTSAYC